MSISVRGVVHFEVTPGATVWVTSDSMDGRGPWMDNVFIERLWRSVKHEEIHLHEHATIPVLHRGLERWFERYNTWRPHEALGNLTPAVVYRPPSRPQESPQAKQKEAA